MNTKITGSSSQQLYRYINKITKPIGEILKNPKGASIGLILTLSQALASEADAPITIPKEFKNEDYKEFYQGLKPRQEHFKEVIDIDKKINECKKQLEKLTVINNKDFIEAEIKDIDLTNFNAIANCKFNSAKIGSIRIKASNLTNLDFAFSEVNREISINNSDLENISFQGIKLADNAKLNLRANTINNCDFNDISIEDFQKIDFRGSVINFSNSKFPSFVNKNRFIKQFKIKELNQKIKPKLLKAKTSTLDYSMRANPDQGFQELNSQIKTVQENLEKYHKQKISLENQELKPIVSNGLDDLDGIDLSNHVLPKQVFISTDLEAANFENTDLSSSIFINCDLKKVNFKGSDLSNCTFINCDLRGMQLNDRTISNVVDFEACNTEDTTIPKTASVSSFISKDVPSLLKEYNVGNTKTLKQRYGEVELNTLDNPGAKDTIIILPPKAETLTVETYSELHPNYNSFTNTSNDLKQLAISGRSIGKFLNKLSGVTNLRTLKISSKDINSAEEINKLIEANPKLESIEIVGGQLKELPPAINKLKNLESLKITDSNLKEVKFSRALGKLKSLKISKSNIEELPQGLEHLQSLRSLNLSDNKGLKEIPTEILRKLKLLNELNINYSTNIEINKLNLSAKTKKLGFAGFGLQKIPESIKHLKDLEVLDLSENDIGMHEDFSIFNKLEKLSLRNNDLTAIKLPIFPDSVKLINIEGSNYNLSTLHQNKLSRGRYIITIGKYLTLKRNRSSYAWNHRRSLCHRPFTQNDDNPFSHPMPVR